MGLCKRVQLHSCRAEKYIYSNTLHHGFFFWNGDVIGACDLLLLLFLFFCDVFIGRAQNNLHFWGRTTEAILLIIPAKRCSRCITIYIFIVTVFNFLLDTSSYHGTVWDYVIQNRVGFSQPHILGKRENDGEVFEHNDAASRGRGWRRVSGHAHCARHAPQCAGGDARAALFRQDIHKQECDVRGPNSC